MKTLVSAVLISVYTIFASPAFAEAEKEARLKEIQSIKSETVELKVELAKKLHEEMDRSHRLAEILKADDLSKEEFDAAIKAVQVQYLVIQGLQKAVEIR